MFKNIFLGKFVVYILKGDKNDNHYIGQTASFKDRMIKHLNKEVKSTKSMGELRLIYFEIYDTRTEAMRRERFLKTCKGYRIRHELIKKFDDPIVNNYNNLNELIESL